HSRERVSRLRGSCSSSCDFCLRAGLRQLSECVYLPAAAVDFRSDAALGVPEVQERHRALRQHASVELADSRWPMPALQGENLAALFVHRAADGVAVSGLLLVFRKHALDIEILHVRLPGAGVDLYRCGNQAASRQVDADRTGAGWGLQSVCTVP